MSNASTWRRLGDSLPAFLFFQLLRWLYASVYASALVALAALAFDVFSDTPSLSPDPRVRLFYVALLGGVLGLIKLVDEHIFRAKREPAVWDRQS